MIWIFALLFVLDVFGRCFRNDEPRKLVINGDGEYDALRLLFVVGLWAALPISELHFLHNFDQGHHLLLLSIGAFYEPNYLGEGSQSFTVPVDLADSLLFAAVELLSGEAAHLFLGVLRDLLPQELCDCHPSLLLFWFLLDDIFRVEWRFRVA